jgi:ribose transport system permease protein
MNIQEKQSFFTMETRQGRIANQLIFPVVIAVLIMIMNLFVGNKLITGSNLSILISNCVSNAFVAWGVSYIWSTGPDFSCAASLILGANAGGVLAMQFGLGYLGLFGGAILTCVILQIFATFVRLKLNLPAWVIGLGMCMMYESIGIIYSTACAQKGETTVTLGATTCKGITHMPWILILLLAGFAAMYLIHSKTTFGMNYQAVSSNYKVAGYMGIKAHKTIYIGVIAGAVMLGVAGALQMVYSSRVNVASSLGSFGMISTGLCAWLLSSGMDKKMNPPAAILLSSFFIAVIFNFLTRLGVPQGTWLDFLLGCFILVFLCISAKGNKEGAK